jgi:hypothetical protein
MAAARARVRARGVPDERKRLARCRAQLQSATEAGAAYYALHPHPAYVMFGTPDFVDELGREYRIAFHAGHEPAVLALLRLRAESVSTTRFTMDQLVRYEVVRAQTHGRDPALARDAPSADRVRLWVRLPTRRGRGPVRAWPTAGTQLELLYRADSALVPAGEEATIAVTVQNAQRSTTERATGYVDVLGIGAELADAVLARRLAQAVRHLSD